MLGAAGRAFRAVRQVVDGLSGREHELARQVLSLETNVRDALRPLRSLKVTCLRMRIHGHYCLERVLWTGSDFVVFDFEGEPGKPRVERRAKRSCVRDLAEMLISFRNAASTVLSGRVPGVIPAEAATASLEYWLRFWRYWVSAVFLQAYFASAGDAGFLPKTRKELGTLLHIYQLDLALFDAWRSAQDGPDSLATTLTAVLQLAQPPRA